jgi:hypothetical protein
VAESCSLNNFLEVGESHISQFPLSLVKDSSRILALSLSPSIFSPCLLLV